MRVLRHRAASSAGAGGIELGDDHLIACLLVTPELLKRGRWPVITHRLITVPADVYRFDALRRAGWVGARVIGSRIVVQLLEADEALGSAEVFSIVDALIERDPRFRRFLLTAASS